ncbi:S-layer homology domain-containing protein [Cohnella thailandensis]|uniref:S-layer homology domain-containing protein n=1 Tax=Cohnella thailandensis TaxID=557557 RepID=A0A841SUU0_9BACL|nr:S-layer homology domain-containing protein [Cohnella thailandensis]MBB6633968.1 S-layer homology domain-containing protein [Cohnella thailandensis]MBP1972651.1 hypothetical protein [Cohnella thailandensis]
MKKQAIIWSAALALGLGSVPTLGVDPISAKTSADFTDLQDLDAATKAKFDALIEAGIFNGISDTQFGVRDEMNRAQFAKVAALIMGLKVDVDLKTSSFKDVKADDPASGYALPFIEALKAAGITDGVGSGTFNPAGTVTKEQLATFLVRVLGKEADVSSTPKVSDNTVSDWAKGYVALALELKLLNSGSSGFAGQSNATRDLLVTGSFETARTLELAKPLSVTGADFAEGNTLKLELSTGIDEKSIDLSKIKINGVALDPKKDSFTLSEDKKTLIIKLHDGFTIDTSKTPDIKVEGLKTVYGNDVKNDESKPIPVTVTTPPAGSTSSAPTTPAPPVTPPVEPAPVLTVNAMEEAIGETTAAFTVKGSVTGTVYYAVLPANAAQPTPAAIEAGTGAVRYGFAPISGGIDSSLDISELTSDTSYVLYAFERSSSGKESSVQSVTFKTDAEEPTTPPEEVTLTVTVSEVGTTSAFFPVRASVTGTVYYAVLPAGAAQPTPAAIEEGTGAVRYGFEPLSGGIDSSLDISGLTPDTSYVLYAFERSTSGKESSVQSVTFETDAEEPTTPPDEVTLTVTVSEVGTTSAFFPVTASVTGTVYYAVLPAGAAQPKPAAIEEGTGAVRYGFAPLSGGIESSLDISGLTPDTSYVLYAFERSATGKESSVQSVSFETDAEEPTTVDFLATNEISSEGFTFSVSSSADVTKLYYLVLEGEPVAINPEDVVFPDSMLPGFVLEDEKPVTTSPSYISASGLTSETKYTLYVMGETASGGLTSVAQHTFTTLIEENPVERPSKPEAAISGTYREGTTINGRFDSTGADEIYYILLDRLMDLTSEDIIKGVEGAAGRGTMEALGDGSFSLTEDQLDESKTYYLYTVASNDGGVSLGDRFAFYRMDEILGPFSVYPISNMLSPNFDEGEYSLFYLIQPYDISGGIPTADYVINKGLYATIREGAETVTMPEGNYIVYCVAVSGDFRTNVSQVIFYSGAPNSVNPGPEIPAPELP